MSAVWFWLTAKTDEDLLGKKIKTPPKQRVLCSPA
jgi:hypothetical protein